MGCGSSQTTEISQYKSHNNRAAASAAAAAATTYGDNSEASTTLSSVDYRSEPDGQEYDDICSDINNSLPQICQQRYKPQAECWAHPPLSSSSHPPTKRPPARSTAVKGPEPCSQYLGHTIDDRRRRSTKAEPSDRQPVMEPDPS